MIDLIVNIASIIIVFFIIWWFWLYKPKAAKLITSSHVMIIVANGVYSPDIIHAPVGKSLNLEFILEDTSHCAAMVNFPDFNISKELVIDKPQSITLTPEKEGEFEFACPMNMYRGKLVIETADNATNDTIDVIIDGGVYSPEIIHIPIDCPINLCFIRKDQSHCAETIVLQDFNIAESIPLNEPTVITITAKHPGTYTFACPMGMYEGKLVAG